MNIVYLVKNKLSEQELQSVINTLAITPIIGALITQPKDLVIAQELSDDILPMFGKDIKTAVAAATEISKRSNRPVVVVGEFDAPIGEHIADSD